jgi:4-hydroxybenzoate polyprenyltransferase
MVSVYESNHGQIWSQTPITTPDVRKFLKGIVDLLIFSSVFMGLQGVGMVYISYLVQGLQPVPSVLVIMLLVPFSVYNMNRKTDEEEDSVNHPDRYRFTKRFLKPLEYGALAAYALAVVIAVPFGPGAVLVTLVPLIAGILYSVPMLPARFGYRRFKEIPLMKNLVVCGSWATILVLLPCAAAGTPVTVATLICFVFFFSYVFIASAIPDMRDTEGDARSGVRTIPVLIGVERTKTLLSVMNSVTGLVVIAVAVDAGFPLLITGLLAVTLVYTQCCIASFGRAGGNDFLCDILLDGGFVIVGGVVFALQAIAPALL